MDVLELRVVPAPADVGGFVVDALVNGDNIADAGAGLGMDPDDVLVPVNRFVATAEPVTFGIARCGCGVYGCGSTDVTIVREGGLVHWDWSLEKPMERRCTFDAVQYDAEVARCGSDFSWETIDRTAGRLIKTQMDRALLEPRSLAIDWTCNDWKDSANFVLALRYRATYQIFVRVPWSGRSAEEMSAAVIEMIERVPPCEWNATWSPTVRSDEPPAIGEGRWPRWRS